MPCPFIPCVPLSVSFTPAFHDKTKLLHSHFLFNLLSHMSESEQAHSESESNSEESENENFKAQRVSNDIKQLEVLLQNASDRQIVLKIFEADPTSLEEVMNSAEGDMLSYHVQLDMRRTFKQFAFFDVIIIQGADSTDRPIPVRPLVQAIVTEQMVGREVFRDTVLKARLGDELLISGLWIEDKSKKTSLNFAVRSIQLTTKYSSKGYIATRDFPRGSRHAGTAKKHKYTKAKTRAGLVADWLLATFGAARLRAGAVLDVAGGAGYLAHALCAHGVAVTIVDPRSPRHANRAERKRGARSGARLPEHIVSRFDEVRDSEVCVCVCERERERERERELEVCEGESKCESK